MRELRARVGAEVRKVVVGQDDVVDLILAAIAVNGHVLLEGVPGVAKTLLATSLARALGMSFRRVQFTLDMLPSDLTGTMTLRWSPDSRVQELTFRPGPVFTNVTHMIPLEFPVLIIIPALFIDFLLNRYAQKNKWLLALMLGATYLVVMLLVHWPLGDFLISPAARNWIFGQNYFAYVVPPSEYHWQFEFVDRAATFGLFCRGLGIALVVAILSSRVGLAAGDALRRLRR